MVLLLDCNSNTDSFSITPRCVSSKVIYSLKERCPIGQQNVMGVAVIHAPIPVTSIVCMNTHCLKLLVQ